MNFSASRSLTDSKYEHSGGNVGCQSLEEGRYETSTSSYSVKSKKMQSLDNTQNTAMELMLDDAQEHNLSVLTEVLLEAHPYRF